MNFILFIFYILKIILSKHNSLFDIFLVVLYFCIRYQSKIFFKDLVRRTNQANMVAKRNSLLFQISNRCERWKR